jgi:hypothetical protein
MNTRFCPADCADSLGQLSDFQIRMYFSNCSLGAARPMRTCLRMSRQPHFHAPDWRPSANAAERFIARFRNLRAALRFRRFEAKTSRTSPFMIDGAPKVKHLAVDTDKHVIHGPTPIRIPSGLNSALQNLGGEHRTEPIPPEPQPFVADVGAAPEQDILRLRSETDTRCTAFASRMISGDEWKQRNGFFTRRRYRHPLPAQAHFL